MRWKTIFGLIIIGLLIAGVIWVMSNQELIMEEGRNILPDNILGFNLKSSIESPQDDFQWVIEKYDGIEKELFNITFPQGNKRISEVCIVPKFEGSKLIEKNVTEIIVIDKGTKDEKNATIKTTENVTYTQPTELKLVLRDDTKQLRKDIDGSFCTILNYAESDYYKFGNETIILVGDETYDSFNTNVTLEPDFAHLNISDESIVAYYSFDIDTSVTTYDYSENNLNGNLENNPTYIDGMFGGAYKFDGSNDRIDLGNDPLLRFLNHNFTISVWINQTGPGGGAFNIGAIISSSNSGGTTGYNMRCFSAGCDFRYSSGTAIFTPVTAINNNQWYHFVGVLNDTAVTLFIDGTLNKTRATDGFLTTGAEPTWIGSISTITDRVFNGVIDDVTFYNRSLSASEVLDLFNNQSSRFASFGDQAFRPFNITQGDNNINVTATFQSLQRSNLSARIGQINMSISLQGLMAYYPSEWGKFWDATDNRNDPSSITGSPTFNSTSGVNGSGGFEFDNSDAFRIASSDSLNASAEFSFSLWVQPPFDQTHGSNRYVLDKTTGTNEDYRLLFNPGLDDFNFLLKVDESTKQCPYEGKTWSAGEWIHLAGTYDGTNIKLYWNTGLERTCPAAGTISTGLNDLAIGELRSGAGARWLGVIDELSLWNRSLSHGEIQSLFNDTVQRYNEVYYGDYQNLTTNVNTTFFISGNFTFLENRFLTGTNNFYTPNLFGNITLDSFFGEVVTPPTDSCTVPVSGNWEVTCSDNCIITEDINVDGNLTLKGGPGNFTVNANITFINDESYIFADPPMCQININPGGSFNG